MTLHEVSLSAQRHRQWTKTDISFRSGSNKSDSLQLTCSYPLYFPHHAMNSN